MLTIYLVDDEMLVRTNIKLMLDKYSDLYTICGEADCAEEALNNLTDLNPDVILSDMVMPGMDGVEFCKAVKKLIPEVHFIALSNYDDYRLVHDTLKNGGDDYLLKHALSPELLHQTLSEIKPSGGNAKPTYKSDELVTFQEKFVLDLTTRLLTDRQNIAYQIHAFGIHLDMRNVCMILVRIDNYLSVIRDPSLARKRIVNFSVCNIGKEILSHYESGLLTHIEESYFCLLLSFPKINSRLEIRKNIDAIIRQLSSNLHTYLNITASFLVGKICSDITDIPDQYKKLYGIMKNSCFAEAGTVLYSEEESFCSNETSQEISIQSEIENMKQELSKTFRDDSERSEAVNALFKRIQKSCSNYQTASGILINLLSVFNNACRSYHLSLSDFLDSAMAPAEQLASFSSLEEAQQWFTHLFIRLNHVMSMPSDNISIYTQKCLIFIRAHYSEPITLSNAADYCGISGSYLSSVFKNDIGQGFSTYLNEYRIHMAAKSIQEGQKDLHEIAAACGFQDYAYFFRVFKKITSLTPTEYRAMPSKGFQQ